MRETNKDSLIAFARSMYSSIVTRESNSWNQAIVELVANCLDIPVQEARVLLTKKVGTNRHYFNFGTNSQEWRIVPEYNMMFLRQVQNHLNRKLQIQGHLFLNEVLDELGLPRTSAGAVEGWMHDDLITGVINFQLAIYYNGDSTISIALLTQGDIHEKI